MTLKEYVENRLAQKRVDYGNFEVNCLVSTLITAGFTDSLTESDKNVIDDIISDQFGTTQKTKLLAVDAPVGEIGCPYCAPQERSTVKVLLRSGREANYCRKHRIAFPDSIK